MKTRHLILVLAALLVAAVAGWFAGRAQRPGIAPSSASSPAASSPAATGSPSTVPAAATVPDAPLEFAESDLLVLAPVRLIRGIPVTGTLRATEQAMVRAKVAGEVRELRVREGQTVSAGQLLARIDPADFELRVSEREAQLRSATAQLEQAQRTLAQNTQLVERGFIARSALDNAASALESATGARDAARAQLASARKALADTAVIAPIAGVVAERFVQPGEKVSPDARLLSIVDLSRIEIEAPVPAAEIGAVRPGQSVSLRIEGETEPREGRILRLGPSTAAGTRSIPVYIGIDNPGAALRAGLFAQGQLAVERRDGVIAVPESALRERAGRSFVYAIVDGRVLEKDVVTGLRDAGAIAPGGGAGLVEVVRGLTAGERIVVPNLGSLRAGAAAVVRPAR
jgi:membrane fusion protein (multidrug efflux system)